MLKYLFSFMYTSYIKKDLDQFAEAVIKNVSALGSDLSTLEVRVASLSEEVNQYKALVQRQGRALDKLTSSLDKLSRQVHILESTNIASRLRTLESRIK